MYFERVIFPILGLLIIHAECQTKKPIRKTSEPTKLPISPEETVKILKEDVKSLKDQLGQISRQLMLQQFFTEEKIRNDGFSGIKQVRTGMGMLNKKKFLFISFTNYFKNKTFFNRI